MRPIKRILVATAVIGSIALSACGSSSDSAPKTKNAALVWCYNNTSPIDIDAPRAAGTAWSIRQLANITRDRYASSRNRYSWANNETVINDLYGPSIVQTSSCGTPASSSTLPARVMTWCSNGSPIDIDAPNAAGTSWSIRQLANITRDYYESSRNRYSWDNNETVINDLYGPSIALVEKCEPLANPSTTQPNATVPAIVITATTQVANVTQELAKSLTDTSDKSSISVPQSATQVTCAAECVAAALEASGVAGEGTVFVSINGGPKQELSTTKANQISVGSAKSMVFSVVDNKGKETTVAVPLDRGDTPAAVPAATAAADDSDSSNSNYVGFIIGAIALVIVVGALALNRRRKSTI